METGSEINLEMKIILLGDQLRNANQMLANMIAQKQAESDEQQMLMTVYEMIAEVQRALIG